MAHNGRKYNTGSLIERDRRFVARVYDGTGGRRDRSFGFRDAATKEKARTKAERFLNTTIVLRDTGKLDPKESRTRIDPVAKAYIETIRLVKDRDTIQWIEKVWSKHLEPFFGGRLVSQIDMDLIREFQNQRLANLGDVPERKRLSRHATINKECTILKAMLNHAYESDPPKIDRVPRFPEKLRENKPREGFIGDDAYANIIAVCDQPWMFAFVAIAYDFGFRKGEMLALTVGRVDLPNRLIMLPTGTTKSGEGRAVVMTEEVYKYVEPIARGRAKDEPLFVWSKGTKIGKPVRDFRGSWERLRAQAGCPGLLIHDFRRSAVRNMELAGNISRDTARRISGHLTDSIYGRYNIQDYATLSDAAKKLDQRRIESGANQVQSLDRQSVEVNK